MRERKTHPKGHAARAAEIAEMRREIKTLCGELAIARQFRKNSQPSRPVRSGAARFGRFASGVNGRRPWLGCELRPPPAVGPWIGVDGGSTAPAVVDGCGRFWNQVIT